MEGESGMNKCEVCGKDTEYFIDTYSVLSGGKKIIHVCPAHQDMLNQAMLLELVRLRKIELENGDMM